MQHGLGGRCSGVGRGGVASALLTAALGASAATGEPASLSSDDLRLLASGKTVHLESPYGTLPVSFKPDGTLSGKASGALAAYLGSTSDRGRWMVQGDRICQKFFKWFAGEMHCMRVRQEGRRIHWRRDDGLTGTATVSANDTQPFERPAALGAPVEQSAQTPTQTTPTQTAPTQAAAARVEPAADDRAPREVPRKAAVAALAQVAPAAMLATGSLGLRARTTEPAEPAAAAIVTTPRTVRTVPIEKTGAASDQPAVTNTPRPRSMPPQAQPLAPASLATPAQASPANDAAPSGRFFGALAAEILRTRNR